MHAKGPTTRIFMVRVLATSKYVVGGQSLQYQWPHSLPIFVVFVFVFFFFELVFSGCSFPHCCRCRNFDVTFYVIYLYISNH